MSDNLKDQINMIRENVDLGLVEAMPEQWKRNADAWKLLADRANGPNGTAFAQHWTARRQPWRTRPSPIWRA